MADPLVDLRASVLSAVLEEYFRLGTNQRETSEELLV
jgi:hypothetical protein